MCQQRQVVCELSRLQLVTTAPKQQFSDICGHCCQCLCKIYGVTALGVVLRVSRKLQSLDVWKVSPGPYFVRGPKNVESFCDFCLPQEVSWPKRCSQQNFGFCDEWCYRVRGMFLLSRGYKLWKHTKLIHRILESLLCLSLVVSYCRNEARCYYRREIKHNSTQ